VSPQVGDRVVVQTPDRREFRGRVTELTTLPGDRPAAVVRLDTGWLTTYPLALLRPESPPGRSSS
jgi:hypothetical protein